MGKWTEVWTVEELVEWIDEYVDDGTDTDRQTDGRTDGQMEEEEWKPNYLYHCCLCGQKPSGVLSITFRHQFAHLPSNI